MTDEQYERWRDFALRMAERAHPRAKRATIARAVEEIRRFFAEDGPVYEDRALIVSYDDSEEHPTRPNRYYDNRKDTGALVCDEVADRLSDAADEAGVPQTTSDYIRFKESGWRIVFECCVRAGIDMAASPSAGVMGYTIGDLRRMYPEGLPEWLVNGFEHPERIVTAPDDAGVWL